MKKELKKQQNYPTKSKVKYVKKAGMFCKTSFVNEKQIIEWSKDKFK